MAYCTVEDVRGVMARDLLDGDGTAASMYDGAILEFQILAAQAEVDARLAGRYTVPFDPVPELVKALTVDVAAYLATLTYRQNKVIEDSSPPVRRYQRALQILQALASGDMDLPVDPTGPGPSVVSSMTVRNPYEGRLFGLDDFGLGYEGRNPRWRGW